MKKLNLNKYAFLAYLKSDFYSWIINNENYLSLSSKYKELIDLSPHRYYQITKEKEVTDLMKPSPMLDGIDAGEKVKEYYKEKYPHLKIYDLDRERNSIEKLITLTKNIMEEDNFILFEGTFTYNDFRIKTDVIVKQNGKVKLAEVKAVTAPLYYHALDVMFQYFLLEKIGYDVKNWKIRLTTMNTNYYLFDRKKPMLKNLFKEWSYYFNSKPNNIEKAIEKGSYFEIEKIVETEEWSKYFFGYDKVLKKIKEIQLNDEYPSIFLEPRVFKGMDSEYESFYLKLAGIPEKGSLFEYAGDSGFTKIKKSELFNGGLKYLEDVDNIDLISKGLVDKIDDSTLTWLKQNTKNISDNNLVINDIKENSKPFKRVIQKYYTKNSEIFEEKRKIQKHLSKYEKVIYMFDFETISQAVPRVLGTKVYEQVPYQYSIHVILDKNDFDFKTMKNIIHIEWIAKNNKDFYDEFWDNFLRDIYKYGEGSFVSYNKSFENQIINNRIEKSTNEKEIELLTNIKDNTLDLMDPFANRWFYTKEFKGSYSIKYVGPYFVPEINYKELDSRVQKGDQSAKQCKIWLISNSKEGDKDWEDVRPAMLEYCKYDTLLMVAIFQRLFERYK